MKPLLALLLCVPAALFAEAEKTVIIAGSDLQASTDAAGGRQIAKLLAQIKADGYTNADRVLFCGDYTVKLNNRPSESDSGIAALKEALFSAQLGIEPDELVLVQGNHDPVGTSGIAPSGANDPASKRYGVFVINEDDYMWHQSKTPTNGNPDLSDDEATVKRTAANLEAYLSLKQKEHFKGPIFVCSHLPLHYSMRSYTGGDGRYAKYIFDVLNRYAQKGLKLFFLFGHNHSNGWDNYLGNARVFLKPGDKMPIGVPADRKRCTTQPIAFTYMNAGYTGYITTSDPNDGADRTLSMSVFEIDAKGNVTIKRYAFDGPCELKAPGVPNTRNNNEEAKLKLYKVPAGREIKD